MPVVVHLVRHAHAVSDEENPLRPLSPRGHDECRRISTFLKGNDAFAPTDWWHSPLVRARETAAALRSVLTPDASFIETPNLLPEDRPATIATRLALLPVKTHLAVVGHEPHLSALASLLVCGHADLPLFELKKGAIITLERSDPLFGGQPLWRLLWHLTPRLVPA